jgi:hypothetical protein
MCVASPRIHRRRHRPYHHRWRPFSTTSTSAWTAVADRTNCSARWHGIWRSSVGWRRSLCVQYAIGLTRVTSRSSIICTRSTNIWFRSIHRRLSLCLENNVIVCTYRLSEEKYHKILLLDNWILEKIYKKLKFPKLCLDFIALRRGHNEFSKYFSNVFYRFFSFQPKSP